jgi:hypothetical protein
MHHSAIPHSPDTVYPLDIGFVLLQTTLCYSIPVIDQGSAIEPDFELM